MDLKEKVIEKRHDEVVSAMKNVANAIKLSQSNNDVELKKLLKDNKDAINNFVRASEDIMNMSSEQITQRKVIESISKSAVELGGIIKDFDARLAVLENRPLPTKLQAVRSNSNNEIEYVIIEYQK